MSLTKNFVNLHYITSRHKLPRVDHFMVKSIFKIENNVIFSKVELVYKYNVTVL